MPLVLSLHFGFDSGKPFIPWYGEQLVSGLIRPGLGEIGPIIIAPDSHGKPWTDPQIQKAVVGLVEHIKKEYNIDEKKVVITGFSMGAMGVWELVIKYPDLFSAAIPIAGPISKETVDKVPNQPFFVIHGTRDQLFPLDKNRAAIEAMKSRGIPVQLVAIESRHYDTPRYEPGLKQAVTWLKRLWQP